MHRYIYALCCAILILSVTDPLEGKRTFGGGRHSPHYPKSGGLSGSGGSHSYPSSGGLSGGSHGYPSSGSHYPSSGGLSGGGSGHSSSGGSHAYPSSGGSHTYPSSGGSHGYPAGKGLSGNSPSSGAGHTTNIHNHYHYSPPQQIRYTPAQGGAPVSYPVYHGPPPTYVYQYKDSGSKYGTLLAGLALLNLGTLAGGAYALSHSGHSGSNYKPQPGEVCKFGIKKDNGDYEETKIDCRLITSFIFEEEAKAQNGGVNTTVTTTVTNVTTVNAPAQTPVDQSTYYKQFPNGTMVPLNATDVTAGIISVCWVAGALVGFLPLLGWHAAVGPHPGCYFVEVMDYNYLLFLYFATIVTPSVLLAAFYTHIYRVVVKQMSAVVTVEGGQGRAGTMLRVLGAAQKREVKATQNLAIIVFFFIICWIPLYTMNAIKAFMPELDIPNPITYFCIIFSHVNSAINPLLYAYHLKDFRAALKGLLCTIIGRGVPIPAAYRPPIPVRRPALERCNALRERPRVYVNSPVWLRQKEAERLALEEKKRITCNPVSTNPDLEPFLNQAHAREGLDNVGPFLIESHQESQRSCRKVEDFIRRVRSVSSDRS